MKNDYTIKKAVEDALDSFPYDKTFRCYELFSKVRQNLRANGNCSNPYDGTIQRTMRSVRHNYNLVCVDQNKSIYVKKSEVDE